MQIWLRWYFDLSM